MEELRSLVVSAQGGDLDAYGQIVRRFQDMAYGYAYSLLGDFHLAEDAAQEAFIEAYRCLSKLLEPAAFPGWFRRIVFKHCDRLTRRMQVPTTPLSSADAMPSDLPGPVETAERREMADRFLEAIRSMPENERTVTTLFYINGYSQKDIAEFLEVPVTTVNNRLHASRKRLRERMISMVADTLRSNAPHPDDASHRLTFLLEFGQRIAAGQPILSVLKELALKMEDERLGSVIHQMIDAIGGGHSFSEALADHRDLFPPMVIALADDGERFGILDETVPLAAEWLRAGGFTVDPSLFAGGLNANIRKYVQAATAARATEVVIDSTHRGPHPRAPKEEVIWVEHVMPDGRCEKADYMYPGGFDHLDLHLKNLTVLEGKQEGDILRGALLLRFDERDAQAESFSITFRPLRDGEEIRILLSAEG